MTLSIPGHLVERLVAAYAADRADDRRLTARRESIDLDQPAEDPGPSLFDRFGESLVDWFASKLSVFMTMVMGDLYTDWRARVEDRRAASGVKTVEAAVASINVQEDPGHGTS